MSYYETASAVIYHLIGLPLVVIFFVFFWVFSVIKMFFFHPRRSRTFLMDAKILGSNPMEKSEEEGEEEKELVEKKKEKETHEQKGAAEIKAQEK